MNHPMKAMMKKIEDEEISSYISNYYFEDLVQFYEHCLLQVMKSRQEKMPSDINDKEWLNFTDFVCSRRGNRVAQGENEERP